MEPLMIIGGAMLLAGRRSTATAAGFSTALPPRSEFITEAKRAAQISPNRLGIDDNERAALLLGICDRESLLGQSARMDRKALDGAGDAVARWKTIPLAQQKDWRIVNVDKSNTSRVQILPPDGRGWGRGVMQMDYWYKRDWIKANPLWFTLPLQFARALQELSDAWSANRKNVASDSELLEIAVAAYNAGATNAYKDWLPDGDPDGATTGGDYSKDVFRRMDKFRSEVRSA